MISRRTILLLFLASSSCLVHAQFGVDVDITPALVLRAVFAFLTGQCRDIYHEGGRYSDLPRRDDYENEFFDPENIATHIPVNTEGPLSLQGLFFLDIPGDLTEVITFHNTNEAEGFGGPFTGSPPTKRMRIMSEGNWAVDSQAEATGGLDRVTGDADYQVEFVLSEGDLANPRKFDVVFDFALGFFCLRISDRNCPTDVTAGYDGGDMTLVRDPATNFGTHNNFDNSVVWQRTLAEAGTPITYEAIQIVNSSGDILEPAWTEFMNKIRSGSNRMLTKVLKDQSEQLGPQCNRPFWCDFIGILCDDGLEFSFFG